MYTFGFERFTNLKQVASNRIANNILFSINNFLSLDKNEGQDQTVESKNVVITVTQEISEMVGKPNGQVWECMTQ